MLLVISPAKTIAETPAGDVRTSDPVFAEQTSELLKVTPAHQEQCHHPSKHAPSSGTVRCVALLQILQQLGPGELRSLMGVSVAIAK